jgi:hypothetical protein
LSLALSLPAAPAPAPKSDPPKGPAPRIVMISAEGEDKLTILETTQREVPVTRTVVVNDGRQAVQEQQTVMVPVTRMVRRSVAIEKLRVHGLDGKKIDAKDLRKLAAKPTPALLSADGKPVDRFYLQLAREGTLVLVVPPLDADAGEAPKPPDGNLKLHPKPPDGEKLPPKPRERDKEKEEHPADGPRGVLSW